MQNINKPLLATLALALLSLASYQTAKVLSPSTQVLGDTIAQAPLPPSPTSKPIISNGIPCSVISRLQQQYCSAVVPTSVPIVTTIPKPSSYPSSYPTPSCQVSLKTLEVTTPCENNYYRTVKFTCTNGITYTLGDPSSCKSYDMWKSNASSYCASKSTCTPTPTYIRPSSTITPSPRPTTTSCSCYPDEKNYCSDQWFHPSCNLSLTCRGTADCATPPVSISTVPTKMPTNSLPKVTERPPYPIDY